MRRVATQSVGTDIIVDDSKFIAALQTYLMLTSKTRDEAIVGKLRDLCWRAAKYTPIMAAGIRGLARFQNPRAVALARLRRAGLAADDATIKKTIRRLAHPARAYMRSGYALAGEMIAKTPASSEPEDAEAKRASRRYKQVVATVRKHVQDNEIDISASIRWSANESPGDAQAKEYILRRALEEARTFVVHDMMRYISKKLREHADMVSAK